MKYFLDTEFLEDGRTINLISIGIIRDDWRSYYAVNTWFDKIGVFNDPWLVANVVPHLPLKKLREGHPMSAQNCAFDTSDKYPVGTVRAHGHIKHDILQFMSDDEKPEFWGYYADYDWVAFCQLFGRMIDLPKKFPKFCRDLKQWCADLGNPTLPKQESGEHNALADAMWNRDVWLFLKGKQAEADAVTAYVHNDKTMFGGAGG